MRATSIWSAGSARPRPRRRRQMPPPPSPMDRWADSRLRWVDGDGDGGLLEDSAAAAEAEGGGGGGGGGMFDSLARSFLADAASQEVGGSVDADRRPDNEYVAYLEDELARRKEEVRAPEVERGGLRRKLDALHVKLSELEGVLAQEAGERSVLQRKLHEREEQLSFEVKRNLANKREMEAILKVTR